MNLNKTLYIIKHFYTFSAKWTKSQNIFKFPINKKTRWQPCLDMQTTLYSQEIAKCKKNKIQNPSMNAWNTNPDWIFLNWFVVEGFCKNTFIKAARENKEKKRMLQTHFSVQALLNISFACSDVRTSGSCLQQQWWKKFIFPEIKRIWNAAVNQVPSEFICFQYNLELNVEYSTFAYFILDTLWSLTRMLVILTKKGAY